jgi:putative membrane protein
MAVAETIRTRVRSNPKVVTGVLTLVGYVLVAGVFSGQIDVYPELNESQVLLFADLIALVNTAALGAIVAGVYFVKQGEIRKHRALMLTAFSLILVFLFLYLWKIDGGFERSLVAPAIVKIPYLLMLAVHIVLSIVAVPVVLHAVVLGLSHPVSELRETIHPKVGRIAVAAWGLSLFLGIVTYVILNHTYSWEVREAVLLLAVAVPRPAMKR